MHNRGVNSLEIKKPVSLKHLAYESIRTAVLQRQLKRDVIYSEQWFADKFKISRTPVREALLQLRTEGLLDVLPNRGVIIQPVTLQDAKDIYGMRAAIEGYCSALLAEHILEPEVQEALERIETVHERCRKDFNYADEMQFHFEIIQYSGNREFLACYNRMRTKIDVFWNDITEEVNRPTEIYYEHKAILDAIKEGDPLRARKASERHLAIILEKVQQGDLLTPVGEPRPIGDSDK